MYTFHVEIQCISPNQSQVGITFQTSIIQYEIFIPNTKIINYQLAPNKELTENINYFGFNKAP